MKLLRDLKKKVCDSKWVLKLKSIKNLEIIVAVLLAVIAIVVYFSFSLKGGSSGKKTETVEMTATEARVSEMISEISGVGKARVLITDGVDKSVVGVVVVAEGADKMENKIKMIRCVEIATGATMDQIEIFEMEKGG